MRSHVISGFPHRACVLASASDGRSVPCVPLPNRSRAPAFHLSHSAGSVSPLHTVHVALKNMADFGVGCVAYVICGYAFAWGAGNSFGGASFFMTAGVQGKAFAE